jgi:MFS transporter, FSR family, fosmidomycin resistance protein
MNVLAANAKVKRPTVYVAVLLALGFTHMLNDLMQSLISASYPILKDDYALDFV